VSLTAIPFDELDPSIKRVIAHGGGALVEVIAAILTYWALRGNRLLDAELPLLRHTDAEGNVSYVPATVEVSLTGSDISDYANLVPLILMREMAAERPDLPRAMETYRCDDPGCRKVLSLAHAWDLAALHLEHGTAGLCLACAKRAAARKAAA
jgi:hypothetical protein